MHQLKHVIRRIKSLECLTSPLSPNCQVYFQIHPEYVTSFGYHMDRKCIHLLPRLYQLLLYTSALPAPFHGFDVATIDLLNPLNIPPPHKILSLATSHAEPGSDFHLFLGLPHWPQDSRLQLFPLLPSFCPLNEVG